MNACQSAVVLLAAACLGPAALAQGLPRTPLASDSAISVRVGMAATWQSMANPAPPDITGEKAADLSEYALTATPTIDNLKDHALALAPLPENPAWYVFRPAGDTYHLTFDIADSAQRLGHIVVSDLATGQVVGSVRAAPGGATLAGQIEVAWEQAYFRIDGHAASGALLFVLGATNRRPDTFVHFSTVGQFAPHRPATVSTPRFPGGCDVVVGVVGDPYNPVGVRVTTAGGDSWFSLGCGARDRTNPTPAPDIMEPPLPFHPYIRRKCIQQPGSIPFPSNERADLPSLANAILSARQEDTTRAITAIAMPPYSDMTGHWHAKFLGRVTAFFAVPYTVARRDTLLNALKLAFASLTVTAANNRDKLAFALIGGFAEWLGSDSGKQSGLNAGMVRAVGDVKVVETQEDAKHQVFMAPILAPVTFQVQPNISPNPPFTPTFMGSVALDSPEHWLSPAPPGPAHGGQLSFAPNGTATLQLPMGYRWRVTAGIVGPPGYTQGTVAFQTPHDAPVVIPTVLTALLQLTVWTRDPSGPRQALVTVKRGGEVVRQAMSSPREGGHAVTFSGPFPPAIYTIEATFPPFQPAAPLIFEVTPAATLEHTVTLGPMAPPPPP